MASKPGSIHRRMAELLELNRNGLTSGQLREKLALEATDQAQLDRRRRELKRWYFIEKIKRDGEVVYVFKGVRETPLKDDTVNSRLRAIVHARAHGRCQMCGKTIAEHGVTLVVDHKIPQDWGGSNDEDNLWSICEECNAGKKAHFGSQDQNVMRSVMVHESVHVRIGELLKLNLGKAVGSQLLEFVAQQEDWQKRTRELRYLGWVISVSKETTPSGRVRSFYKLEKYTEWPPDPTGWIRRFEQDRARRNAQR